MGTFFVLFVVNFIVLISWQLVAPLEWTRVDRDSTDVFDRAVESYALCTNDDAIPFVIVLVILNIVILIVANWWAYQARNIETEYHESRYIGIAMASILQAWGMGIPILIVVWDNPQAKFFVEAGIIFVTAMAVQLLIFIPKILAVRADRLQDKLEKESNPNATISPQDPIKDDFEEHLRVKSADGDVDNEGSMRDYSELLRTLPGAEDEEAVSVDSDDPIDKSPSLESTPIEENRNPIPDGSPSAREMMRSTIRGSFVDSLSKSMPMMRFSAGALALHGDGNDANIAGPVGGIRVTHNPRVSCAKFICIFLFYPFEECR